MYLPDLTHDLNLLSPGLHGCYNFLICYRYKIENSIRVDPKLSGGHAIAIMPPASIDSRSVARAKMPVGDRLASTCVHWYIGAQVHVYMCILVRKRSGKTASIAEAMT